jgi:MurNAc alpha-1-phosphate uridylyltransferase
LRIRRTIPRGDFGLEAGRVRTQVGSRYTFSGIGLYRAALFDGCKAGAFPLAPLAAHCGRCHRVAGELYDGDWVDIGSIERLDALNQ